MTVNFSRIVKFAAAVSFFSPPSSTITFFDPDSLTLGFIGWFLYLLPHARHAVGTENDPGRDDRGAKTHPLVVPHNFFPLGPLPEIASTRVLHPPLLAGEVATDASALFVLSLSPSLSFSRAHAPTFFSVPSSPVFPRDVSGKGPVGPVRLTRVLFDYYFGTYRALVTSLCGHMVVGGWPGKCHTRWRT